MERRSVLVSILAAIATVFFPAGEARAQRGGMVRMRRRVRRRVRRRIRRRIRRRVAFRLVAGRRKLVVPTAVAVGWELMVENRLVVVQQVQPTSIVVQPVIAAAPSAGPTAAPTASGATETIEVEREDNAENGAAVEGSPLPAGDTSTPGIDAEVEVEEEVEEDAPI